MKFLLYPALITVGTNPIIIEPPMVHWDAQTLEYEGNTYVRVQNEPNKSSSDVQFIKSTKHWKIQGEPAKGIVD